MYGFSTTEDTENTEVYRLSLWVFKPDDSSKSPIPNCPIEERSDEGGRGLPRRNSASVAKKKTGFHIKRKLSIQMDGGEQIIIRKGEQ